MITVNQTENCYGEWYTADSGCPPGTIVEWFAVYGPPNVDISQVVFENQGGLVTRYKLPENEGKYGISAIKRTPK